MALIDNLQGYFKCDESSGDATDSSGNGNTLTNNNTATYVGGIINNGFNLVATSSQWFSRTDANLVGLDLEATNFTINSWVKFASLPSTDTSRFIVSKQNSASRQYSLFVQDASGTRYISTDIGNGDTYRVWDFSTGVWYMVTVRYTNSTKNVDFSVNATAQGATFTAANTLPGGTAPFRIGAGFGDARFFDGQIDEVGVWDRRLTDAEITELYNAGAGLQYPFSVAPAFSRNATMFNVF